MFKLIFPALLCLAFACPTIVSAQDCGCCDAAPICQDTCQKTRKRLALVSVSKSVTRLKRVCETDACGCTRKRLARVSQCVTRKKLALVDVPVDPCKRGLLSRLGNKFQSVGCFNSGCNACDSGCDTCDGGCGDSGCGGGCDGGCAGGCDGGGAYPTVGYPSESYPTEAYPTDGMPIELGQPIDAAYPAPSETSILGEVN